MFYKDSEKCSGFKLPQAGTVAAYQKIDNRFPEVGPFVSFKDLQSFSLYVLLVY